MNLHSSVFSPDDRMTDAFYADVKKHLLPEHSLSLYGIMTWNWPRHESHSEVKSPGYNLGHTNKLLADIIVSKTTIIDNPLISEFYDTIAQDVPSTYIAFKRKTDAGLKITREELQNDPLPNLKYDRKKGALLWQKRDLENLKGKCIQLDFQGKN